MRLLLALIFSLACHALVFQWLATGNFNRAKSHGNHLHALQVDMQLGRQEAAKLPASAQRSVPQALPEPAAKTVTEHSRQHRIHADRATKHLAPIHPATVLTDLAEPASQHMLAEWWGYYHSSQQVDRKALPISNIHKEMLGEVFISGMPIKLRLYINQFGQVVRIEDLAVLEQDRPFRDRLAALLMQMTFMAARKDSAEVNSFQDIEFSFEPLITLDNPPSMPDQ